MAKKLVILILVLAIGALALLLPSPITKIWLIQKKFDHKTEIEVGFGQRANQQFGIFPSMAIMYRRRIPRLQSQEAYEKWLAQNPSKAAAVREYQEFLNKNNVGNIIKMRELLNGCADNPLRPDLAFDVPPRQTWPNIVPTLKWFNAHAQPIIGEVRLYHGYRNPEANNTCGSHSPVHPANSAIDFVPLKLHDPAQIERLMCTAFRSNGKAAKVGMGFYGVGLIHIDTRGYRSWGPDTRSATSPCRAR